MKPLKRILIFLFLLIIPAKFYAMESEWQFVPIQVKFAPQDNIKDTFYSFLNKAKYQVVIAMYWITDSSTINLLTELKKKGLDIRIIFDESSLRNVNVVNTLLKAGVIPIIFPSQQTAPENQKFMHHKFLVIDESIIFTGSANFTQKAVAYRSNYENVAIIYSREISQQYLAIFHNIELDTFNWYIDMAKAGNVNRIAWANRLLPMLYSTNPLLQKMVSEQWAKSDAITQARIALAFKIEFITPEQKVFLNSINIFPEEGMSKQQASHLIEEIIQQDEEYDINTMDIQLH